MPLLICPNDGTGMQEINRNGVLIDICPQCRGVWLDRGELEKLLELVRQSGGDDWGDRRGKNYEREDYYRKKRFNLLDFFD